MNSQDAESVRRVKLRLLREIHPPYEDDPWLKHTAGSRLRLIAAYGIACLVIAFFLVVMSFAG